MKQAGWIFFLCGCALAAACISGCGNGGSLVTESGCNRAACRRCVSECIMEEDKTFEECSAKCFEKEICDTPDGKCK